MDIIGKLKKFIENSKHVMSISYKPTPQEYNKAAKLIIFGILLLGALGFVIAIIVSLVITGSFSLI
jgi:protein translocase SEC61 complex gamma subunit